MATATAAASSSSSPARSSTSSCSAAAARHHRPSAGLSLAAVVRARPAMVALMAFAAMFWAHRALRAHYHAHCNGDLFRVLLFNQSNMCANIAGLIAVVEFVSNQFMSIATSNMWGVFASAGVAAAAAAAAAAATATASAATRGGVHDAHEWAGGGTGGGGGGGGAFADIVARAATLGWPSLGQQPSPMLRPAATPVATKG